MKLYLAFAYILIQAWTLSACAANADSATTHTPVNINGEAYNVLSHVVLVKDPNWQRVPQPKVPQQQQIDSSHSSQSTQANSQQESQVIARFGQMQLVPATSVVAQQALTNSPITSEKNKNLYVRNSSGQVFIVNGEVFANTQSEEQALAIAEDYPIDLSLHQASSACTL